MAKAPPSSSSCAAVLDPLDHHVQEQGPPRLTFRGCCLDTPVPAAPGDGALYHLACTLPPGYAGPIKKVPPGSLSDDYCNMVLRPMPPLPPHVQASVAAARAALHLNGDSYRQKLESSKRKLHEDYQRIARAKKQRTIQVIPPQPIPPDVRPKPAPRIKKPTNCCRPKVSVTAAGVRGGSRTRYCVN